MKILIKGLGKLWMVNTMRFVSQHCHLGLWRILYRCQALYWLITQLYVEIWMKDVLSFDLTSNVWKYLLLQWKHSGFFIVSLHILFLFYLAFVKIDVFLRVHERVEWEVCVRLRLVLKDVLCNSSCICCSHAWAELWLLTLTLTFPSIHIYLYMHVYLCTHSHALSLGTFQSHFLY